MAYEMYTPVEILQGPEYKNGRWKASGVRGKNSRITKPRASVVSPKSKWYIVQSLMSGFGNPRSESLIRNTEKKF